VKLIKNAVRLEASLFNLGNIALATALFLGWLGGCCGLSAVMPRSMTPWGQLLAGFGGLALISHLHRSPARSRVERNIAPTLVAGGFCGSCGYPLEGLVPESDGCLVCPECSAAWREARVGRRVDRIGNTPGPVTPSASPRREWIRRAMRMTPGRHQLIAPDDRGRLVHVPDRRLVWLRPERRRELGESRLRLLRSLLRWNGGAARWAIAAVILALAAAITIPVATAALDDWRHGHRADAWDPLLLGVCLLMVLGLAILVTFSHAFYNRREAARTLVRQGVCGSCATDLSKLVDDVDGYLTCPDCGAGWKRDKTTDPPGADGL
jgi:hypothetical protein